MTRSDQMLEIFLNIAPSTVTDDIKKSNGRLVEITEELRELRSTDYSERSPDVEAQIAHLSMLQAYETSRHPKFFPEHVTFYAAHAVEGVCDDAQMVAFSKGQMAKLSAQLRELEIRHGLTDGEYWPRGEGPEDHQKLSREADELSRKIYDTLFIHILRKYLFTEIADQFERDPIGFAVDREVGRRLIFPPNGKAELFDDCFKSSHGEEALERVYSRLKEIALTGR